MILRLLIIGLLVASGNAAMLAQERNETFQILNVPYNAPLMGMGGVNVSWTGRDVMQFIANPAIVSDSLSYNAAFNYTAFSGAYKMVATGYSQKVGEGIVSGGIRNIFFGEFDGFDAAGNQIDDFNANQTVVTAGYSLRQGNFRYGLNVDFTHVGIAGFSSNALSLTAGALFSHPDKNLTIGAAVKNVGVVLSDFSDFNDGVKLPWDAQLGVTFKPEFMPFRFSVTGHHLFNGDLLDDQINESVSREIFSHIVVGSEVVINKNISLLLGYNHLIRQELKIQDSPGSAGFSYGFIWQTRKVTFSYGRGAYHSAGASHVLSLNIDLNKIFRII